MYSGIIVINHFRFTTHSTVQMNKNYKQQKTILEPLQIMDSLLEGQSLPNTNLRRLLVQNMFSRRQPNAEKHILNNKKLSYR